MRTTFYGLTVALTAFLISLGVIHWSSPNLGQSGAANSEFDVPLIGEVRATEPATQMAHAHPLREVSPNAPTPSVTHLVFPDAVDGYNIQILATNFAFTPAAINSAAVDNEGHAHLYVNGEKVARIYGTWIHLPSSALSPGGNAVSVTLNANDHSEWTANGLPVMSTVVVYAPEAGDPIAVAQDAVARE